MKGVELDSNVKVDPSKQVEQYNQLCKEFDHEDDQLSIYQPPTISVIDSDQILQNEWFIPDSYLDIDLREWLYQKCDTTEEIERVQYEMNFFEEKEMEPILRLMIFLVEDFRERKIVWGVGRGSSVASFVLFLIGIHRVNSLQYELDFHEFLK